MTEAQAIIQAGEWFLIIAIFALAIWRGDPWLYVITGIGLGYQGFTWYPDYQIIGVIVMLLGAFCFYKTVRHFTG